METPAEILASARRIKGELVLWRRYLHMYPELSGREFNTAEFVAEKLRSFGVDEVTENFADSTAVVAVIRGNGEKTVALRADMDALPIEEKGNKPYASNYTHIMHACGHDAHTAMLLGCAKLLVRLKERLFGNVKLIFQPCEERSDCKGARHLVENRVLENPDVSAIFAIHVFPELPAGTVGINTSTVLASSDTFKVVIKGKSSHASRPHKGVDPVVVSAQSIVALHHLISRCVDPVEPAVITVGKVSGGYAENVIPEEVTFEGTVRVLNPKLREKLPKLIERTVKGIASAYGADCELEYFWGSPPLVNDAQTTAFAITALKELLGERNVLTLDKPTMGGEDFSYYLQRVPGTYIRLGTRNEEKGIVHPLHSSLFDIDEDILPVGTAVNTFLALKWLWNSGRL